MDKCADHIEKIKSIFAEKSELPASLLMEKLELKTDEELKHAIERSQIFELTQGGTTVSKKTIVRFRIIIMKSDEVIQLPIARFVEPILLIFPSIAYIRFVKNIGQLVVFESDFLKVDNVFEKHFTVSDEDKKHSYKVTFHDTTFDDRREFSHEHSKHMEGILRYKYGKNTHFAVEGISIYRNGIYLGIQKFKSIKEMQSFFGKLLKSCEHGKPIPEAESATMKELLKYHTNAEKKTEDIDHFEVGKHPKFSETSCFFIVKKDGTKEDFSFNKCIKQIGSLIK